MRRPVFLHIRETFERRGAPRNHQILTQGVLIREEGLIRIEYQLAPDRAGDPPLNASVMKAEPFWHMTRPSFGADLVTLCPDQFCRNSYSGDDSYDLDVVPAELRWDEQESGGEVVLSCRMARLGHPYRSYSLHVRYTNLS